MSKNISLKHMEESTVLYHIHIYTHNRILFIFLERQTFEVEKDRYVAR